MNGKVKRKYTGWKGDATKKRPGTEAFMRQLAARTGGALWNNGTYGIRLKRGKKTPSVHGTARAGDASYRHTGKKKGIPNGRPVAINIVETIVAHASDFGLEMLIDYQFGDFGRAYRCDRDDWKIYKKMEEVGGGTGDWIHFEISDEFADSAKKVNDAFLAVFGPLHVADMKLVKSPKIRKGD